MRRLLFRRRRPGPPGGLPCRELVELVTDYFEGTLSPADRRRFEEHIAACEGCTAYVEQLRTTREALGGLAEEHVPEETARELGAVFRDWRASRS
jgi:anti-sigma factor RsiW